MAKSVIKNLILDVDGVFTDGKYYYTTEGKVMKKFGVKKAGGCSKYCLGLIYFDMVTSKKKFKDTIKFIEKTGGNVSHQKVEKKLKNTVKATKLSMVDLKKSISDVTKARKAKKHDNITHTIATK